MSEDAGDRTEQATPKKLEDAILKGQFARSAEVQTAFALTSGLTALLMTGKDSWLLLGRSMIDTFSHIHEIPVSPETIPVTFIESMKLAGRCAGPVVGAVAVAGIIAGGLQSRFRASPEAIEANWERINPIAGVSRIFSPRAAVPAMVGVVKLLLLLGLSASTVERIIQDPLFYTPVDLESFASFMANSAVSLGSRLVGGILILAAVDYGYQFWRTKQDLMMTKQEVKDEAKGQEGNPQVKAQMRRRRRGGGVRKMLLDVPKADVVVTNPTHLSIALRYDRKTMKAPIVVAKGSRLNALRIREIAKANQIPIIENKPIARLMFKHARVGGEIPAEVYSAVAEILAYVYRTNAYRYYRERSASGG